MAPSSNQSTWEKNSYRYSTSLSPTLSHTLPLALNWSISFRDLSWHYTFFRLYRKMLTSRDVFSAWIKVCIDTPPWFISSILGRRWLILSRSFCTADQVETMWKIIWMDKLVLMEKSEKERERERAWGWQWVYWLDSGECLERKTIVTPKRERRGAWKRHSDKPVFTRDKTLSTRLTYHLFSFRLASIYEVYSNGTDCVYLYQWDNFDRNGRHIGYFFVHYDEKSPLKERRRKEKKRERERERQLKMREGRRELSWWCDVDEMEKIHTGHS